VIIFVRIFQWIILALNLSDITSKCLHRCHVSSDLLVNNISYRVCRCVNNRS